MKKCPFCAEEIQDEAIKCKHCGEWLEKDVKDSPSQVVEVKKIEPPEAQPQVEVVSPETDEEIKRKKEAGLKQCPTCGKWDVHRAIVEDGNMGDWCPHCKKSLVKEFATQVRPWIRYWARFIDYIAASYLFIVLGYISTPEIMDFFLSAKNEILLNLLIIFSWTFPETGLLAAWGYTPGKWLLGISVRDNNGEKLSYGISFKRAMKVYWMGMGIGFPIATLVTNIVAYNNLTEFGVATWDKDDEIVVTHHEIKTLGLIIFIALIIVTIILHILSKIK